MNRRRFLGAAALAPLALHAQSGAGRPYRVAVYPDMIPAVRKMLDDAAREVGWSSSQVQLLDSGFPYGSDATRTARKVLEGSPDLVLTYSSVHALALHRASSSIPIVMWSSGYPVEVGIANSLARPGKNVTGNTQYASTGIWSKLIALLAEVRPGQKRIGVFWGYVPPSFPEAEIEPCYRELREAARGLQVALEIVEVPRPESVAPALARLDAWRAEALLITTGPSVWPERASVMRHAVARRWPTASDFPWPERDPGAPVLPLLTYSPPTADLVKNAVHYVERIRRGAKPGDLPIQLPARFELVVNQNTARDIAMSVPRRILLQADRVIE